MLIFPLKKQWYEKIKSGEKTIEYREVKPYWTKRLKKEILWGGGSFTVIGNDWIACGNYKNHRCILRLGYTKQYMSAFVTRVQIVDGKGTDLAIDKPVYAIHLSNVREENK